MSVLQQNLPRMDTWNPALFFQSFAWYVQRDSAPRTLKGVRYALSECQLDSNCASIQMMKTWKPTVKKTRYQSFDSHDFEQNMRFPSSSLWFLSGFWSLLFAGTSALQGHKNVKAAEPRGLSSMHPTVGINAWTVVPSITSKKTKHRFATFLVCFYFSLFWGCYKSISSPPRW